MLMLMFQKELEMTVLFLKKESGDAKYIDKLLNDLIPLL